jgi:hypothetical protein
MFIQNAATTNPKHVNGLAIRSRCGGQEILVQWANGDQRWCPSKEIVGSVRFIELEKGDYSHEQAS